MKISFPNREGLTLIEALVIIVVLFVLAGVLLPAFLKGTKKADRNTCVNNLKQVGLSFRMYAGDNNDQYPMNVFTNGQLLVLETNEVHEYFLLLANELGTPRVLACPQDRQRQTATNFTVLRNRNISYFVGLDGSESLPPIDFGGRQEYYKWRSIHGWSAQFDVKPTCWFHERNPHEPRQHRARRRQRSASQQRSLAFRNHS